MHRPFPLKARDSHSSSKVWPRFGKYEFLGLLGLVALGCCVSAESSEREEQDNAVRVDEGRKVRSHGQVVVRCLRPWFGIVAILGAWYGSEGKAERRCPGSLAWD